MSADHLLTLLQTVHGLGDSKAAVLAAQIRHDHHSPSTYATKSALRNLLRRFYFEQLSVGTQADLIYNFSYGLSRDVIHKFVEAISHVPHINPKYKPLVCGSYRRHKPINNDIDIVMLPEDWQTIYNAFGAENIAANSEIIIQPPFQRGESRIETVVTIEYAPNTRSAKRKYNVKMDVFFTQPSSWAYAVLYATGNGMFNVVMRNKAKHKGYRLNQNGLYKMVKRSGQLVVPENAISLKAETEQEIFEHLNMKYKLPENRSI